MKTGRWIYPNGTYYEGNFANNKPDGKGTWYFKNGNVMQGSYAQKDEEPGEGEEEAEAEEGEEGEGGPKKKIALTWNAQTDIAHSAHQVNSVQQ